jgi:hypothetical protein
MYSINYWADGGSVGLKHVANYMNPLTPELNPSAQRCLARYFLLGILFFVPCILLIWVIPCRVNQIFSIQVPE